MTSLAGKGQDDTLDVERFNPSPLLYPCLFIHSTQTFLDTSDLLMFKPAIPRKVESDFQHFPTFPTYQSFLRLHFPIFLEIGIVEVPPEAMMACWGPQDIWEEFPLTHSRNRR